MKAPAHPKPWISLLASLLLVTGCGDKIPEKTIDIPGNAAEVIPPEEKLPPVSRQVLQNLQGKECEILPLPDVARIVQIPEGDVGTLNVMGCQYSWPKENADDIRAANKVLISEGLAKGRNLFDIGRQQGATENTVNLYLDTFFTSTDQQKIDDHFRAVTNNLTAEEKARNRQITENIFSSDNAGAGQELSERHREIASGMLASIQQEQENESFTAIEGIGVRAAWSDYSNRLVVQHRNLFFTLNVTLEDDQLSRQVAKELAPVVIGNLEEQL